MESCKNILVKYLCTDLHLFAKDSDLYQFQRLWCEYLDLLTLYNKRPTLHIYIESWIYYENTDINAHMRWNWYVNI